jgi:hypothetical protein
VPLLRDFAGHHFADDGGAGNHRRDEQFAKERNNVGTAALGCPVERSSTILKDEILIRSRIKIAPEIATSLEDFMQRTINGEFEVL